LTFRLYATPPLPAATSGYQRLPAATSGYQRLPAATSGYQQKHSFCLINRGPFHAQSRLVGL